ncbi:MAG: ubiquinone/menaquinone biosynthesis methyltransferase [Candidatus Omnitrophica bacterium]|nr:ubiquinone/menaquinone biosynthesis methyltransferase [Candidatus Omnitrophota bacterium]
MALSSEKKDLIRRAGFQEHFQADSWSDFNRQFFNGLAPKYDALNEVLTFGQQKRYKTRAVRRSGITPGDLVLDICTGTGDMAFLIADEFERSTVIGIDVAESMLHIARRRAAGRPDVEFRVGDAMALPFTDGMFDAAVMSYGLRNLDDLQKGIDEVRRVVRPGGKITFIDLGKPEGALRQLIYRAYFENLLPFLGRHLFHRGEFNSFRYLPESNKNFPTPTQLRATLTASGLRDIQTYTYMGGTVLQLTAVR